MLNSSKVNIVYDDNRKILQAEIHGIASKH